ncbi:allophanate hydrolase [Gayadomonas joobiniege]|uniref:allophanate hydrolase n=1 Tax=Gayadomonas joobiniege TaxID=1234606 RepID=UPI000382F1C5|nr:allophanate hydrolase [Gayadomonas joobiniege]
MTIQLDINSLHAAYKSGESTPAELITDLLTKAKQQQNVWIYLLNDDELKPYLDALVDKSPETHPLYGVPFAIKDNIDLAGVPTTAACAEFAYTPETSAFVVEQLIAAGAIPLGKTNLDQFATGLVGTRSPYGETPNAFNPEYISGGSSSGSAVALAAGVVSFSLGTDTAGSGRVPACFNNLVGLKPSKGLLSTSGVVPACRSLDCVSIFALTASDARQVFNVTSVFDASDEFARPNPLYNQTGSTVAPQFTFAIPKAEQLAFFGDSIYQQAFADSVKQLEALGGKKIELDFEPMLQAAKLLYEGPWVAERWLATQDILLKNPEAMLDVTRTIISAGDKANATDMFAALYKLQKLKRQADQIIIKADFMVTPTAGRHYTRAELAEQPITYNSNLGYYTNFMNLLDFSAIAVPTQLINGKRPFGITLFTSALSDQNLLTYAERIHQACSLPLGATDWQLPANQPQTSAATGYLDLVVCGAHLSGMPLNIQLQQRQAVLVETTTTAAHYQMYSVAGQVERPALIRSEQGYAFEVEVWRLPIEHVGSFLQGIAAPLGLGKVELADGRWETGFIAEATAATGNNISKYGSWRKYQAAV